MTRTLASIAAVALLAACSGTTVQGDADVADAGDADASTPDGDAADEADGPEHLECDYPIEGHGVNPDEVLPPFQLDTCAGERTSFPALWCGYDVTVVQVSTSWCPLCFDATTLLQRDVMTEVDADRVRLVELLVEGEDHDIPATTADCDLWTERFETDLSTYIPPDGVVDGALSDIFRAMPAPSTFLVDSQGVIRYRTTIALPDRIEEQTQRVRSEIEEILAHQ